MSNLRFWGVCIRVGIFIVVTSPFTTYGAVVINEVAWMGTTDDANDEWIELYNNGTDAVTLSGWTLSDSNTLSIPLSGTLAGGMYALLERSDDASVPGVSAFQIYTGALTNSGTTLTLKDSGGAVVDSVVGGENWGALGGNNETKDTAQRQVTGTWITASPTPGATNKTEASASQSQSTTIVETTSGHAQTGVHVMQGVPAAKQESGKLAVTIDAPATVYVHEQVTFTPTPSGVGDTIRNSLVYEWNFGDTYTSEVRTPTHAFEYPGTYIVVLDTHFAKQVAQARVRITVLPITLALTRDANGIVRIENKSSQEVDVGGFLLQAQFPFTFPKHTIIPAGGALAIPAMRVGNTASAVLFDTTHTHVASVAHSAPARTTYRAPVQPPPHVTEIASTTETATETIPTGVIHIGTPASTTPQDESFITRFFKRVGAFFGF